MIIQDGYCESCGEIYTDKRFKWCKLCQIKDLKENFTNLTGENEKINDFIQKMQLKINNSSDTIFEWISYNQFLDIKEVDKDSFSTVYSAKWEGGPLYWSWNYKKYIRIPDKVVALKYSNNLQNIDEFLNEV